MTEILNTEYVTLFRVDTSHNFYLDSGENRVNHQPDLLFKPTPECREILRNYHLLFKPNREGFRILAQVKDTNTSPSKLFIPLDEGVKFTFAISLLNPFFVNFSNLPIKDTRGKLYRFTNLKENAVEPGSLSQSADGHVSDVDLLSIKSKRFVTEINIKPPVAQTRAVLKDRKSALIIDETIKIDMGFTSSKGIYNTDLSLFEDGIYSQTINGDEDTFFASDHSFTNSIFGVVEIFNGSEPPDAYKFVNSAGDITPMKYLIPFAARSCIWKYILVPRFNKNSNPDNITITNPNYPKVTFNYSDPPEPEKYNEHISQFLFYSDREIELRCKDNNCTINFPDSAEIPPPSYKNIKDAGSKNFYVESFIYI